MPLTCFVKQNNMKVSKYDILGKIGEGQYGHIYLASLAQRPGSRYALKQVDRRHGEAELLLLPQVRHPNIIKVHQIIQEAQGNSIVFEYAPQGDLSSYVRKHYSNEYVPEEMIRSWLLQMCLALHYLHHELHLIHRDIKTINVLVMEDGLLKLGDFGLAKKMSNEEQYARSSVGTPYYLSPQTLKQGYFNAKSDVWGLGCLLYELCTGEKPFKGTAFGEIFNNIINGVTGEIPQCYSRWLADLIRALLQKQADKRPSIQNILQQEELRKEFQRLKSVYQEYQGFVYPELNLRTTKYLYWEERYGGNMKLFSDLKTAKKDKAIKQQIQGLGTVSKPQEKKIVERVKFANQSLRNILGRRREAESSKKQTGSHQQ